MGLMDRLSNNLGAAWRGTKDLASEGANFVADKAVKVADAVVAEVKEDVKIVQDTVKMTADLTGKGLNKALDVAGDFTEVAIENAGVAAAAFLEVENKVIAGGLDLVGADETAKTVRANAAATGDAIRQTTKDAAVASNKGLDAAGVATEKVAHTVGEVIADPVQAVKDAASAAADKALGPKIDAYKNEQVDGVLGEITQRLDPGQGAYLSGTAGVEIPSQTIAAVLTLGAGAAIPNVGMKATATAAVERQEDGKLKVIVTMKASTEATWAAGAKIKGGLDLGRYSIGGKAGIEAKASLEAAALGQVELTFDPNNPADAARLKSMLGTSTVPPGVNLSPEGLVDAMKHNFDSITMGAQFKASAGITAEAELGMINKKNEGAVGNDEIKARKIGGRMAGMHTEKTNHTTTEEKQVAGLGTDGSTGIGIGGELGISGGAGASLKVRHDGSTQIVGMVNYDVQAKLKLTTAVAGLKPEAFPQGELDLIKKATAALGAEGEKSLTNMHAVKLDLDPRGNVKGVAIETTNADADTYTGSYDAEGNKTSVTKNDAAIKIQRTELTPAGIAKLNEMRAKGVPAPVALFAIKDMKGMTTDSTRTVGANQLKIGGNLEITTGVGRIGLNGQIGGGVYQSQGGTDLDVFQRSLVATNN